VGGTSYQPAAVAGLALVTDDEPIACTVQGQEADLMSPTAPDVAAVWKVLCRCAAPPPSWPEQVR
jgi:hypothetical protein